MTGYVRQSTAEIIAGEQVTAEPVSREFNQIQAAFNASTGHLHDGSTGNGPKLQLNDSTEGNLAIVRGGTGAGTAADARTNLGLVIGTNVQANDALLTALAALTTADNKGLYFTGVGTVVTYDLTAFGRTFTGYADATAARVGLSLVPGTNVQAYDTGLAALAAFNTDGILVQTADNTFVGRTLTGTANQLTVTNGDGVSGNPTISIPTSVTFPGRVIDQVIALTDGASVALNAALGNTFQLTLGGNGRTIAAPSNPVNGQKIVIRVYNPSAFNTFTFTTTSGGFRGGTDVEIDGTEDTPASGLMDYYGCIYNSTDTMWDVVAKVQGY